MGSPNIIPAQYDPRSPSYTLLYTTTKLITLYHDQTKFFTSSKMMLGYPSYSAERRQRCTTTTIRSRRAHSRRVLDTAALNAYVPNDVGSKSHSELTWNHVVAVFTFFGLLMTALMSLCCYSHVQFVVEQRRLAGTEFNSLPQRRRLPLDKTKSIKVKDAGEDVNGEYKPTTKFTDVPTWFNESKMFIFGGSNTYKGLEAQKHDWNSRVGSQWYIFEDNVIFWDITQGKWHMAGKNKLFYRFAGENKESELPIGGWYSLAGRVLCDDCKAIPLGISKVACKAMLCDKPEDVCSPNDYAKGPKAHIAIGAKPAPTST